MTCERCDQWLEELFAGAEPDAVLIEHLVACRACRTLYESAVALRKGLAEMLPPQPAPELTDRIVTSVLFDRRRRQARRRIVARAAALAAGILVVLFASEQRPGPEHKEEPAVIAQGPSLRKTLTEASSAVVESARRQVNEALSSTLWLVPPVEGLPVDDEWQFEPALRPLQEASQGVAAGLDPVADKARRAFALFVRDLSPRGKPGS